MNELENSARPADQALRCDTCGRPSAEIKRVVLDSGYNRANSRPLYNCPECYEVKRRDRGAAPGQQASAR